MEFGTTAARAAIKMAARDRENLEVTVFEFELMIQMASTLVLHKPEEQLPTRVVWQWLQSTTKTSPHSMVAAGDWVGERATTSAAARTGGGEGFHRLLRVW